MSQPTPYVEFSDTGYDSRRDKKVSKNSGRRKRRAAKAAASGGPSTRKFPEERVPHRRPNRLAVRRG